MEKLNLAISAVTVTEASTKGHSHVYVRATFVSNNPENATFI